MTGYSYQVYQQKLLEELRPEEKELRELKMTNEGLIERMKEEQQTLKRKCDELQREIDKLSSVCRRINSRLK